MATTQNGVRLLGISGSLRKASCNTAILEALRLRLEASGKAQMTIFGLHDIPSYNSDIDGDLSPPSVVALREAIASSDGLVLASPEYNHGMSGVLKNALDWASRPAFTSVLTNKPAITITSSPGLTGGVRAHAQLRATLFICLARLVVTPDIVVSNVFEKMVEGVFADEANLAFAEAGVDRLIAELRTWAA